MLYNAKSDYKYTLYQEDLTEYDWNHIKIPNKTLNFTEALKI